MVQFDFLVNGTADGYYAKEIRELGGRIYAVTPKRVSLRKNRKETLKVMKNGAYRVIHVHQDSMIGFAVWCAQRAGTEMVIAHAHTTSANGWYRRLAAVAARRYVRTGANVKLACSEAAARWIYGEKEAGYTIIKNAVDAELLRYRRERTEENREKAGLQPGKFVVGTCGRLSAEKNQGYLLEIFYELKKIKEDTVLFMVGDGPERQRLQEKAEKLGILDSVVFVGMVDHVEFYYSIMDCFIMPSVFEGLPLAGIEAQAAGLPCFFSQGITREIKVTPAVFFEGIDKAPKVWAKQIAEGCSEKRDTYEMICRAGYDIGENVRMLQSLYLSVQRSAV